MTGALIMMKADIGCLDQKERLIFIAISSRAVLTS